MAQNNIKYVGEYIISYVVTKCRGTFATISHKHTADEVGADTKGSAATALGLAEEYTDDKVQSFQNDLDDVRKSVETKSELDHTHNYAGSSVSGGSANSAVKLETARNINGVSFDGTSDIFITSEPSTTELKNVSINDCRTVGFYCGKVGNGCANLPNTVDDFGMIVFKNSTDNICQLLVDGNTTNIMYLRTFKNTGWTNWVAQYSSANKPTPEDIGAATYAHGTHVTYDESMPVMDGTASAGTAITVSRSNHQHPTDITRAGKAEFDEHVGNTTTHISSTERDAWNSAKSHADSTHAPVNAEKNQNAFSNVLVGDIKVVAHDTTDTLVLEGYNMAIVPDTTNDKIAFSVADGTVDDKGVVQLTDSTSSTSTITAATPNSVKSAYDLANSAKTAATNAQATANSKADAEHTHAYDASFSSTSENPIQNKIITEKFNSLESSINSIVPIERTINGKPLSEDIELSASDVNADSVGTADSKVSDHNASTSAHSDIRILITTLTTRLNTLADSDDETLDQMSELVEYIKANRTLIEEVTTKKVNVADIIDNLTTNVANKPLSAAQGVAIKSLIDQLKTVVDGKAGLSHSHTITDIADLQSTLDEKSGIEHSHDLSVLINALGTSQDVPTDSDYFISQYVSGGNSTTTYHRRPLVALWSYIKDKLSAVATSGSYNDLEDKPTIGDATIIINQAGQKRGAFNINQTEDLTIELTDFNTDTQVTNTPEPTTKAYITGTTYEETSTGTQVFDPNVYLDDVAGQLVANTFKGSLVGNADTASKLGSETIGGTAKPIYLKDGVATECSSLVGSKIQPIYMDEGTLVRCNYTLEKSVPADAEFTDTTYGTATPSDAGLMSAQDKEFLDFIKQFFVSSNPNQIVIGGATLVYDSENGLKVVF